MKNKNLLRIFLLGACLFFMVTSHSLARGEDCANADYICGEALVKFSRRLSDVEIREILRSSKSELIEFFPKTRLFQIAFSTPLDTLKQIHALKKRQGVLFAVPNERIHAQLLPNDADFDLLWGLNNSGQTEGVLGTDIAVTDVWDFLQDGSEVLVAVLDSGVDYNHPDLAENIWTNPGEIAGNGLDDDANGYIDDVHGYDFANDDGDPIDDNEHGTHVAGILGATGNNGIGVTGVAWQAKIMAVKILNSHADGSNSEAISGIEYALANGAKILNNSWGGSNFNQALLDVIRESDAHGAIFIAASGNLGRNADLQPFYPASYDEPNILSMASIDADDALSSFSNYGKLNVDLAAPGGEIYSTKPSNTYGYISGTSMATPYATGAAALLWSKYPELNHRQIRNLILQGVSPRSYLAGKTVTGGLLNVANSFTAAENPDNHPPEANAGSDQTLPLGGIITLNGSASDADGDVPLIFEWSLSTPAGSGSHLSSAFTSQPSFIPDREGDYVATLTVSDSLAVGLPDSVKVTVAGGSLPLPVVVIYGHYKEDGGSRASLNDGNGAPSGKHLIFDGRDSSSLFTTDLIFEWRLVAKPSNSQLTLTNTDAEVIGFTPDLPGTYTVRLLVEDGISENIGELTFQVIDENSSPLPPNAPASPQDENPTAAAGCSLQIRE